MTKNGLVSLAQVTQIFAGRTLSSLSGQASSESTSNRWKTLDLDFLQKGFNAQQWFLQSRSTRLVSRLWYLLLVSDQNDIEDALSSGKAVSAGPSNEATAIPAPEVSNPLVVTLVVDNREHNTLNDDESRVVEEHDAISGPFEQTAAQPPVQKGKKKAKASVAAKTTRATPKATAQPAAAAVRSQSRRVAAQIAAEHLEEASEETPAQTSGVFRFDKATEEKILDDLAADKWADARKHLPEEERPAMATDTAEVEELEVERKGTKKGSKKAVWVCRCTFSLDYARGRFSYGLISCGDRFASKDNVDRHIRTKHMGIKRK